MSIPDSCLRGRTNGTKTSTLASRLSNEEEDFKKMEEDVRRSSGGY
jgi:hypothetical protein